MTKFDFMIGGILQHLMITNAQAEIKFFEYAILYPISRYISHILTSVSCSSISVQDQKDRQQ